MDNKILNPKTNRYVNKTGRIGKAILLEQAKQKENQMYLDHNILDTISDKADIDTKRILKEVCKHFRDTINVEATFGRKNAEFLIKYLQTNSHINITISSIPYVDRYLPIERLTWLKIKIDKTPELNKIIFIRHRPTEVDDVIGLYKYHKKQDLKNLTMRDIVKKQKLRFVSNILNEMNYIITCNLDDDIYKSWKLMVKNNNPHIIKTE